MFRVESHMFLTAGILCLSSNYCSPQTTPPSLPTAEQCTKWRAALDNNLKLSDQGKEAENLFPYCVQQGSGPSSGWFRGYETYQKPPDLDSFPNYLNSSPREIFEWMNKKYQS
jgi:hypothetical protein